MSLDSVFLQALSISKKSVVY